MSLTGSFPARLFSLAISLSVQRRPIRSSPYKTPMIAMLLATREKLDPERVGPGALTGVRTSTALTGAQGLSFLEKVSSLREITSRPSAAR